jgi:HK97 family phage major capsid protein
VAVYNSMITRGGTPGSVTDPLVPEPLVADIIQQLPNESVILNMAKPVPMPAATARIPVLSLLPIAYFVGNDSMANSSTLKQTTKMMWENVHLIVEEIAAIVPIPDAYVSDANVPLWDEVRPRLTEAIGKVIDQACLFGVGLPSTWSPAIVPTAISVGNTRASGTGTDIPQDLAFLAEQLTKGGISDLNGWVARPGFKWRLIGTRSATQNAPIYEPDLQDGRGGNLYGYNFRECANGAWDPTVADLVAGDWSKALVGIRQDMTFKMFDQGIINDANGAVVWNAMQNDGQALRVTMRMAFATANPVNALRPTESQRYYFGVLHAPAGQMS